MDVEIPEKLLCLASSKAWRPMRTVYRPDFGDLPIVECLACLRFVTLSKYDHLAVLYATTRGARVASDDKKHLMLTEDQTLSWRSSHHYSSPDQNAEVTALDSKLS